MYFTGVSVNSRLPGEQILAAASTASTSESCILDTKSRISESPGRRKGGEAHAGTGAGAGVADGTATAASVAAAAAGGATTTPTTTSAKVLLGEGEEADAEVVATTAGSGASSAIMSSSSWYYDITLIRCTTIMQILNEQRTTKYLKKISKFQEI